MTVRCPVCGTAYDLERECNVSLRGRHGPPAEVTIACAECGAAFDVHGIRQRRLRVPWIQERFSAEVSVRPESVSDANTL